MYVHDACMCVCVCGGGGGGGMCGVCVGGCARVGMCMFVLFVYARCVVCVCM